MKREKIKLAIVINDLNIGGAEKLVVDQLKYFNRNKFELSLVTLFDFPEQKDFFSIVPNDVIVHKLNFKGFKDISSWIKLAKIIKKTRPDVVISHLFFSNTVTRALRPFFGYKVVAVEHNTYTYKTKLQQFMDRWFSKISYKVIAVSETVADFTSKQEHINRFKFVVIPNGVDIESIYTIIKTFQSKQEEKIKLGFSAEDKLIVNVARMVQQKDHELLIRSFAEFHKIGPEYKLVILGDGPLRSKLESLVTDLGLESVVYMPGIQSPLVYYYASEFLVLTSKIEGFAIVGIEAMALGLPMVSTRTAGPDKYLVEGENGFFINTSTVEGVVSALERAIKADRNSLREKALKVAAEFDIQINVRRYEELSEAALG
jgi:glycosyltransferase involved in cell wall biosynthesis